MNLNKFTVSFIKDHIKQTWRAYLLLFISIACIIYTMQFTAITGYHRIMEGIALSYIAACIFYYFVNLYPEYTKQKQGIITIENELNNIVINISHILGIIKSFSDENYTNINLPDDFIYVKERKFKWKNFLNPRRELNMYIEKLQKELNNIKIKYCVLPINLISILNKIERLDLADKLKSIYFCLDKKYDNMQIQGIPDCFIELEKAINEIKQFGINSVSIIIYEILTEQEKQE